MQLLYFTEVIQSIKFKQNKLYVSALDSQLTLEGHFLMCTFVLTVKFSKADLSIFFQVTTLDPLTTAGQSVPATTAQYLVWLTVWGWTPPVPCMVRARGSQYLEDAALAQAARIGHTHLWVQVLPVYHSQQGQGWVLHLWVAQTARSRMER